MSTSTGPRIGATAAGSDPPSYEGILEVTNADNFRDTLVRGIGPAKAFGFGLLSVAPIRS